MAAASGRIARGVPTMPGGAATRPVVSSTLVPSELPIIVTRRC